MDLPKFFKELDKIEKNYQKYKKLQLQKETQEERWQAYKKRGKNLKHKLKSIKNKTKNHQKQIRKIGWFWTFGKPKKTNNCNQKKTLTHLDLILLTLEALFVKITNFQII